MTPVFAQPLATVSSSGGELARDQVPAVPIELDWQFRVLKSFPGSDRSTRGRYQVQSFVAGRHVARHGILVFAGTAI